MTSPSQKPIEDNLTDGEIVELCAKALNYLQAPKTAEFDGLVKDLRRSETAGNFVIETVTKLFEKQRRSLLRAKATGARTRIDPAYALHCMTLISMFTARRQRTPQRDKLIKKLNEKASAIHALFLELGLLCENAAPGSRIVKNSHSETITSSSAGLTARTLQTSITRARDLRDLPHIKANPQEPGKPLSAFAELYKYNGGEEHGKKIEVYAEGGQRRYCYTSGTSFIEVTFEEIGRACNRRSISKKMLNFLLMKINEQVYHNNELSRNYITFTLRELTEEYKISKHIEAARTAFEQAIDALTSIKIRGFTLKGKKRIEQSTIAVLFTYGTIENGVCVVGISDRINWQFILDTYTILPKAYYQLSAAAADLLYYIFQQARQNCEKIKENGKFNIGLRAVQNYLNLPSENDNRRPAQTIRRPIEEAITAIEEACKGEDFTITPKLKHGGDITSCKTSEYLDNGYLEIGIGGEYRKHFESIHKKTAAGRPAVKGAVKGAVLCAEVCKNSETEKTGSEV